MFEDSTFESMGRIHTRSRGWMIATFAFNASVLLALIFIPLIYPQALPQIASAILMEAPAPVEEPKPVVRPERANVVPTQMPNGFVRAPSVIPKGYQIPTGPEVVIKPDWLALDPEGNGAGSSNNTFSGYGTHPNVRPAVLPARHVSSGVMQGMLIYKVIPRYPAVAQAARVSGTVVLQATISRSGTIENLRAVGGPALLQQAALDAVKQWRYRPYMLNCQPVEVETTVNVQFTLD
ncbi:MAG: TonB family protein [Terracidiphilus sp.]